MSLAAHNDRSADAFRAASGLEGKGIASQCKSVQVNAVQWKSVQVNKIQCKFVEICASHTKR